MIANRLRALGGRQHDCCADRCTGACDLDMELVLAGGCMDAPAPRPSLWRRLVAWFGGGAA